jgi:hypothetical protein
MMAGPCWLLVIANTAEPAAQTPTTAKKHLFFLKGLKNLKKYSVFYLKLFLCLSFLLFHLIIFNK